jgi:hypothetical protein
VASALVAASAIAPVMPMLVVFVGNGRLEIVQENGSHLRAYKGPEHWIPTRRTKRQH